jgi:hypothetical protein
MSGLTTSVSLRRAFTPTDSGVVTELLRRHANDVKETRKGRHWTFIVDDAEATASVLNTARHHHDFEDILIEHNLEPDDAPDAIIMAFPTRRECDHENCFRLVRELAEALDGIDCGIRS